VISAKCRSRGEPQSGTARASAARLLVLRRLSTRLTHEQPRRNIMLRTHGSIDSTDRCDRRLTSRRFGSGRCGGTDTEARRHRRGRAIGGRACLPQPIRCGPMSPGNVAIHAPVPLLEGSGVILRRGSRLHVAFEARLEFHLHAEATLRAHVPHSTRGPVE